MRLDDDECLLHTKLKATFYQWTQNMQTTIFYISLCYWGNTTVSSETHKETY